MNSTRNDVTAAAGYLVIVAVVIAVIGILATGWYLGSELVAGLSNVTTLVALR